MNHYLKRSATEIGSKTHHIEDDGGDNENGLSDKKDDKAEEHINRFHIDLQVHFGGFYLFIFS